MGAKRMKLTSILCISQEQFQDLTRLTITDYKAWAHNIMQDEYEKAKRIYGHTHFQENYILQIKPLKKNGECYYNLIAEYTIGDNNAQY